jgi:hypothetical protein
VISTKTVFVLGAGASNPFGLPLGSELKQDVLTGYGDTTGHAVHLYNTTPFSQADTAEFVNAFGFSGLGSVDAFLERREKFLAIGKSMMGIELAFKENPGRLWQDGGNWLTYLFSSMIGNTLEEFAENQVSFVTFNYDRSVEHFLFTSLLNSFGQSVQQTKSVVEKIPIIHLHGRLGYLPWQATKNVVVYGTRSIDVDAMKTFRSQIKVVHEDINDGRDREFSQAKELLGKAARVHLLGFGFGVRNVQRLGLADLAPHAFSGTSYGLTEREKANCQKLCGGKVNLLGSQSLDFLRNFVELS